MSEQPSPRLVSRRLASLIAALAIALSAAGIRLLGVGGETAAPLLGLVILLAGAAATAAEAGAGQLRFLALLGLAALVLLHFAVPGAAPVLTLLTAAALLLEAAAFELSARSRSARSAGMTQEIEALRRLLALAEEESATSRRQADEADANIAAAAAKTIASLNRLEGLVSGTADGIEVLNGALNDTARSNEGIVESQGRLREALEHYSREVAAESASIQALAASVAAIAETSRRRRELVEGLLRLAGGAEAKLSSIRQAVDRMIQSAGKVGEMSSLITEVADRTNLLAMNASIEAAHAGQSGKGFAVIAGHVRALSVEAANGSRAISATLGETTASIAETAAASDEAISFFRSVSSEIQEIATMLEELLAQMHSISSASAGLLESVQRIEGLNTSTKAAVDSSEGSVARAKSSIGTVVELVATIQHDSAAMMRAFGEMRAMAQAVGRIGGASHAKVSHNASTAAGSSIPGA